MNILSPLKLSARDKKKLAMSELILLILAVVGLLIIVWLAWFVPSHSGAVSSFEECVAAGHPVQESFPEVCVTKEGKRFVNPAQSVKDLSLPPGESRPTLAPQETTAYLTITEWNVRFPLNNTTQDLMYVYDTQGFERVSFTYKKLQDIGICKTDVGVSMTRTTTKNSPPYTIDNPEPLAHVADHYYYLAYGGSPCFDADNTDHMKAVNTINGGDIKTPIKELIPKLQAVPAQ